MFLRKTEGQGLAEYALILALIAILVITALLFLSGQIDTILSSIGHAL
jgi:pilus assembly protein Flp/PilA